MVSDVSHNEHRQYENTALRLCENTLVGLNDPESVMVGMYLAHDVKGELSGKTRSQM